MTVSDKSKGFNDKKTLNFIPRKKIVYLVMHLMSQISIDLHEMILTKHTQSSKQKMMQEQQEYQLQTRQMIPPILQMKNGQNKHQLTQF